MSLAPAQTSMPSSSFAPSAPQRQYFLDWLRIIAFALLIPYHVGMYYVSWEFHVKSPQLMPALEPWMRLLSPWRMDLLFIVSGAATALMLTARRADFAWLRERARRLLWPLLFGMLVIVPPQTYFEVIQKFAYSGSYWDFMQRYLSGYGGFCAAANKCLILPTWNHLWYLPYLFTYTVVFWLGLRWRPQGFEATAKALAAFLARPSSRPHVLLWPIIFLTISRLLLRERFPITHALADDWYAHLQYGAMFLFGIMLARDPRWAMHAQALRWLALLIALAAWGLLVTTPSAWSMPSPWLGVARPLLFSTQQWCALLAALGFAHRWLNVDAPMRRYLNDAVFPLYILHQTLTISLAMGLLGLGLPAPFEAAVLILGTFGFGFLGYELVRRIGWLRTPFGLKRTRVHPLGHQGGGASVDFDPHVVDRLPTMR